jgi:hypothetical protein
MRPKSRLQTKVAVPVSEYIREFDARTRGCKRRARNQLPVAPAVAISIEPKVHFIHADVDQIGATRSVEVDEEEAQGSKSESRSGASGTWPIVTRFPKRP